ncbi:MAG: ABC transporter permease [Pseudomonadales bacterium]
MTLSALQRKLWRELWAMRGQALAIIGVIIGGVGVCVMSLSTYHSLQQTRDAYYRDNGFAQVFASLKRAPERYAKRLEDIPGVAAVDTRVVAGVNLQLPGFADPITGKLVSVPDHGEPRLNRLHLMRGRMPDSRRGNEVLIGSSFADAHTLEPGDSLVAILNGRHRKLRIVGVALSPEYILQIAPGSFFPDYKHFSVLWMARKPLAAAYDMDGAFNDVALQLQVGSSAAEVIERLDPLLKRYGGLGAYDREDQFSNKFLKDEFKGLQTMAFLFPTVFLGVAVFLLNVVLTRLISTQREIIAVLKAFGYSNIAVAWHYSQLVLMITGVGILLGYVLGFYVGQGLTRFYADYYVFPVLIYDAHPLMLTTIALLTLAAALTGTLRSVLRAAALPPAEAMRPEPPVTFRPTLVERLGLQASLSQASRMMLRNLERKLGKSALSVLGIAMATAIMMVGNFQGDAVNFIMHVQFKLAQQQDLDVSFTEPTEQKALYSLRNIPGVNYAEGQRNVSVRLRHEQRSYLTGIQGLPDNRHLQAVLNTDLEPVPLPSDGLMLTERLATRLGAEPGDQIQVEVLEGKQPIRSVTLTALSQQFLGLGVYMRQADLNTFLREGPVISNALLTIDLDKASDIYRRLREMPRVAGINLRNTVVELFNETMNRMILVFALVNSLLGGVIAFGVVYNTVRINLAERSRELASLRVLGYTHGEVAYILFGELALMTLLAIPIGFVIGAGLCAWMSFSFDSELYRIPLVLSPNTFALSALVVLVSTLLSSAVVWRKLRALDLVEVLKTRE